MGILVEIVGRGGQPQDAVLVAAFGLAVPGPFEPGRDQPAVMIERQRFSFGEGLAAFVAEWSGGDVSAGEWRRMRRSGAVGVTGPSPAPLPSASTCAWTPPGVSWRSSPTSFSADDNPTFLWRATKQCASEPRR